MSNASSNHDLDRALVDAQQNLNLMRNYIQSGQVNQEDFLRRLAKLNTMLEMVQANRREYADAERFTRLYEVSRAIGSSLDLKDVLAHVMDAIISLTGAERGFLMLLNDDGVLDVRTARNFDQETLDSGEFAVSRTITRDVFESGQPVVATNASEDPRYAGQASVVMHQLRSIMAAPLRARGSTIGVVYVDNRIRTGLFRESDLELLEAFASQAGVAIDNARLFEETDEKLSQRMEELQTLQWIDRQLAETLEISKVMDVTVEWAMRICNANGASLAMLPHEESTYLEIMSQTGDENPIADNGNLLSRNHPLLSEVIESGASSLYVDKGESSNAILCVPIRQENRVAGVIILTADSQEAFNDDAQAIVGRLADRAAIPIENGRLYAEIKRANDAKSEFVGVVAHELKVPMTGIRGYADLLAQFTELDERSEGFVGRIKGGVMRMQTLVEDLSDISRIESGNLRVEVSHVDVQEMLEEAKAGTQAQIDEREHTLIENIPDNLPLIEADFARSVQVLVNLMSNAYKYTPNGGTITVSAEHEGDRVYVSVEDTGVGLSNEELEKLGTKFWRSDNEHTLKQRGTGLGFNITHQLINLMGATLNIESEVGKGSVFTVGFKAQS